MMGEDFPPPATTNVSVRQSPMDDPVKRDVNMPATELTIPTGLAITND